MTPPSFAQMAKYANNHLSSRADHDLADHFLFIEIMRRWGKKLTKRTLGNIAK